MFQLASLLGSSGGGGGQSDSSSTSTPISNYFGGRTLSPFTVGGSNLVGYAALALAALAVFMLMRR